MKKKLYKSPVEFIEDGHRYLLDGKELCGITGIISKYLYPNMYSSVDEEVLRKAAERGSEIHKDIENYFGCKVRDRVAYLERARTETKNLAAWAKSNKVNFIASEYLVSDEKDIASKIDLVDDNNTLYDIKTYAECTTDKRESARWQLSIYKYLFELNNPELKVEHLRILHLRDEKCEVIEVIPVPESYVVGLINAWLWGMETFDNPLNKITDDKDEKKLLEELLHAQEMLDTYSGIVEDIKSKIKDHMTANGSRKITKDGGWSFSLGEDTVTDKFDDKAFKKDHPSMWSKYIKQSKSSGRFVITYPKKEEVV